MAAVLHVEVKALVGCGFKILWILFLSTRVVSSAYPVVLFHKKNLYNPEDKPALTVSSQSKRQDVGIRTLIGDYAERGENHGRKYFQKLQAIPGHEEIKVFLYYWDQQDGPEFTGWWFGDQVGGSQVDDNCYKQTCSYGSSPPSSHHSVPRSASLSLPLTLAPPCLQDSPRARCAVALVHVQLTYSILRFNVVLV